MTEEINNAYDGGLYGELIKDRIFKDSANMPGDWTLIKKGKGKGKGSIALDFTQPVNEILKVCLKLNVETSGIPTGIANGGHWGIPVKPQTTYQCSFYAKTSNKKNDLPHRSRHLKTVMKMSQS